MLIGDELLSGKIQDQNGAYLAKALRERGVQLCEISTLPDQPEVIAQTLLRLSLIAEWIFSSGGVGPTHDDCTMEGMALGLGRPLQMHAELESRLRHHYGDKASAEALSMALLPQGAQMYGEQAWPVTGIPYGLDAQGRACQGESHRLYILPGIPSLFAKKIEALAKTPGDLPQGPAWEKFELELCGDESRFSAQLSKIAERFPKVAIGSYPRWESNDEGELRVRVRLTFESRVRGRAEEAMLEMRNSLD